MTLNAGSRGGFLGSIAGVFAAVATTGSAHAEAALVQGPEQPVSHALVLSGGGARGAYEAGLICALAERGAVRDGQPLAPYGVVCGTSIGAINAWFVATGQYAALRKAWSTLAHENIIAIKRPYRALMHPAISSSWNASTRHCVWSAASRATSWDSRAASRS